MKHLLLFFLLFLFSCSGDKQNCKSFPLRQGEELVVCHHPGFGTEQYSILWKGDIISKEWSYLEPDMFIRKLDIVKEADVFIIEVSDGDGCPAEYRLLSFNEKGSYFLSDKFGNCESFSRIEFKHPILQIHFDVAPELERKALEVEYDVVKNVLTETGL